MGSYVSFKWITNVNLNVDISLYHQVPIDDLLGKARLASSIGLTYNFTDHLGLVLRYQNNYDPAPVVPIDKLFNKIQFTVQVSF